MLLLLPVFACDAPGIPEMERPAEHVVLGADGLFRHHGVPYSGYTLKHAPGGEVLERTGFLAGRRHGPSMTYFIQGTPRVEITYHHGARHGLTRTWWANGTRRGEVSFTDGVKHGSHRSWYDTGARFLEMNYADGEEVGLQRAWLPDGTLYKNYEVRNGRAYGLQRTEECFELNEENIVASPDLE
ncbi:MAG: hypothetical protein AAFV53_19115 [Myxococcota bacterium]